MKQDKGIVVCKNDQCVVMKECYDCAQEKAVLDKVQGWARRSCREGLQVARGRWSGFQYHTRDEHRVMRCTQLLSRYGKDLKQMAVRLLVDVRASLRTKQRPVNRVVFVWELCTG